MKKKNLNCYGKPMKVVCHLMGIGLVIKQKMVQLERFLKSYYQYT